MNRVHLDNAATSFPKPDAVHDAVDAYQRTCGAAVGRGTSRAAVEIRGIVERARLRAARLLGAGSPESIAFVFNGTDALNVPLRGGVGHGEHVITSAGEHNSVLRPLRAMEIEHGVSVTRVPVDEHGRVEPGDVLRALRPETRLVALQHASNVTGVIQPIAECGEIARRHGALFVVDAAQSAGHLPIDLTDLPVDVLACSGHKGLLGPLGTGVLYVRPGIEDRIRPLRVGGTGTRSEEDVHPAAMPDRFEAGNPNAPGLAGLEAALAWIEDRGVAEIRAHESALASDLIRGLAAIEGVHVIGPANPEDRVGVVSVTADGFEPHDLATILDESFAIDTRAGLHCAPGVHRAMGTFESGGTLRFSVGVFTTPEDVARAIDAVREILGAG